MCGIGFYGEPITYKHMEGQISSIRYENPLQNENDMLKKQIDNMAKFICESDLDEVICSKIPLGICEQYNNGKCIECIKKYFNSL